MAHTRLAPRFRTAALVVVILGLAALGSRGGGCATTQSKSALDQPQDLQMHIEDFHRYLRWEMFAKAAESVHPDYVNTFRGRYEEYGDDLDIVDVSIERIERPDGTDDGREAHGEGAETGQRVQVETQQKWYVEPNMQVRETSHVEIWMLTPKGWKMRERMRRKEWRRRQQEGDQQDDE